MRASSVLTTAASVLLASTVFAAAQGVQRQGPGAEGGAAPGQQQQREGQQGKQAPQKGERGDNANQKGAPQAQEREGPKGKQQVQKEQQGQKEQGKQQGRTEGQGGNRAEGQKNEPKGKAGERTEGQGQRERTEGQQGGRNDNQKGQRTDTQKGERTEGSARTTLTTEQKTKVRETVLQSSNAPRVNNVNFQIRVGTAVPTSVRVVEVAPVLVEVHPEWRGFFYFIVNDEIIIVDRNHHIVAILEV